MDIFAERFKELKEKKKCTYQDIADYLKINLRSAKYYASGGMKPEYYGLIALADFFDVSTDYLTGRTDNPDSHKP